MTTLPILPNPCFSYTTPDEVAECWNDVGDTLYQALWDSMSEMPPLADQIDIEESGPGDALGLNTVESVWDRFTIEQKVRLNWLAEVNNLFDVMSADIVTKFEDRD
jgi:hypothetical protein